MEINGIPPDTKLCNLHTILFHILKKSRSTKNKILLDLHIFIKAWNIAGKSIGKIIHNLHNRDYSALICTRNSTDVISSVSHRREYEFSCSNSPAYPAYIFKTRKKHSHHRCRYRKEEIDFVQKVFDVLNEYDVVEMTSTLTSPLASLPGFGHTPLVRQLRVTDSPFPVKDTEENPQVDKDAEEFIKKFYKNLGFGFNSPLMKQLTVTDSPPVKEEEVNPTVDKDAEDFIKKFYKDLNKQGRFAALEPPSPYNTWER